jgi:hypothetical protein
VLLVVPTVVLPVADSDAPTPSITTRALLSDACHDNVIGSPGHADDFDALIVNVGKPHALPVWPPPTDRRLDVVAAGGGVGGMSGAKEISRTG